ncbi:MAG: sulfatase-like hydrolase/transferase, partial [Urechidicola sp.]|nr:sulfatase-like hydrolase/transferase [Urechidicola sp.]
MKQTLLFALLLCLFFSNKLFSQGDPNIILIIADDMGWTQVSNGLTNLNNPSDFYETPRLDELASEGIAFPHGYVNGANCAPTRAAILTGQHASRPANNVFNVDDLNRGNTTSNSTLIGADMGLESGGIIYDQIPVSTTNLAARMRDDEGYVTAHFGKLHVGEDSWNTETSFGNDAYDQGFNYNYGGGADGGPGDYHASSVVPYEFHPNVGPELDVFADPYTLAEETALIWDGYDLGNLPSNVSLVQATDFNNNWTTVSLENEAKNVNDAMADAAISFMNAENDEAFFMHFSNFAVHGPTDDPNPRPDLLAKYNQKLIENPSSLDHKNVGLAAILENMDQTIGRIVDYLKVTDDPRWPGHKLSENTLVYFVSDNGGVFKSTTENSAPLRGMKGEYYEGGIRSVTIAWSEATWLANKGTVNNTPVVGFDVFPTFIDMARGNVPVSHGLDGESLWPILNGTNTDLTRDNLFWHFPGYLIDNNPLRDQRPVTVVRNGDYKLIHSYETADYELYNLADDISETNNLLPSDDQSTVDLANNMIDDMIDYLNDVNAPLPTFNADQVDPLATVPMPTNVVLTALDYCEAVSGYEAYWNFNSDNTLLTNDAGLLHDAVSGTITAGTGAGNFIEGDQSAMFNGTSDKVQYNSGDFLKVARTNRSVAVWLKPDGLTGGIQNIFDEGSTLKGITLRLNDNKIQAQVTTNEVGEDTSTFIEADFDGDSDGDWHHVVFVFKGSNSLKLYIDGVEEASVVTNISSKKSAGNAGGVGGVFGTDAFGVSNVDGDHNYYKGKMDAFAIYTTALTESQIEQMNPKWYADVDTDGYGDETSFVVQCEQPIGYVKNNSDCDDDDININPNAEELVGNAIDEDCDGIAQNVLVVDDFNPVSYTHL